MLDSLFIAEDSIIPPTHISSGERLFEDGGDLGETIETLVVNIPRYPHCEQRCKDAKTIELQKFEDYDAYEELSDQDPYDSSN